MSKTNKIILIALIVAILMLGIGYAAIQNITLNITGTASADPSQANYNVKFTGNPIVSDSSLATAEMINDTTARIDAVLSTVGETVNVAYEVENTSNDLSAEILLTTTNSNEEYFDISSSVENSILAAGESTLVTVTVELIKPAIEDNVTASIGVELEAVPIQPGEEGNLSGGESTGDEGKTDEPELDGSSAMTLKEVKVENIGDYIDLGNNYINTEETSDDWRILYVDEENVYVILSGYLPAVQVPEAAGLDTNTSKYKYNVWSDKDLNTLINGFLNTEAWSSFTNGIEGATATGTPTLELLMNSYVTKDTSFETDYQWGFTLNRNIEDYELYDPKVDDSNCLGYSFATPFKDTNDQLWVLTYNFMIAWGGYKDQYAGVRPVVSIPTSTTVEMIDEVWKILK